MTVAMAKLLRDDRRRHGSPTGTLPTVETSGSLAPHDPPRRTYAAATLRRRGTQRLLRARSQPLTIMERSRWTKLAEESISTALRLGAPGEPLDHTGHFDPSHSAICEVSFLSSGWRLANFWVNRML